MVERKYFLAFSGCRICNASKRKALALSQGMVVEGKNSDRNFRFFIFIFYFEKMFSSLFSIHE